MRLSIPAQMSTSETAEPTRLGRRVRLDERASPLELFFDLVFVFALTQVTSFMADETTWEGVLKGMLVLAALWWAWGAYAWLTNYINTDAWRERFLVFVSMAAMLVAALAVPNAFGDDGVLFGCVFGVRGFRVSPSHFAERFGLIVIIALGESIVAIGVGAEGIELGTSEVVAAVLGVALSAALWWAYFDVVALLAERHFSQARGHARILMARDAYSYLHLPMIAGIILVALGIKKTIEHVDEPLKTIPAVALLGGIALYHASHVAFRLRGMGTVNMQRLLAALACLALIPVAREVDALAGLALGTAVAAGGN